MADAKWKVGDLLYWRQDLAYWRANVLPLVRKSAGREYVSMGELSLTRAPVRLQVVEVHVQTCYAGTQVHYLFRKSDMSTFLLTEAELTDEASDTEAGSATAKP